MKYKYLLLLGVSIISYSIFSTNVQASSADQMEEIPDNVTTTNNRRADDWFSKPDEVNAMEKASEVEKADREKKEKERKAQPDNENGIEPPRRSAAFWILFHSYFILRSACLQCS